MNDREAAALLRGFDAVWRRVTAPPPPPAQPAPPGPAPAPPPPRRGAVPPRRARWFPDV